MPRYIIHYSFVDADETYDYIFEITCLDEEAALKQLKESMKSWNITVYDVISIEEI